MRNFSSVIAGGLAVLVFSAGQAAFGQLPNQRPVVSPYINLNRQGSSPGVNYYGIVRPELNYQNSINQLQVQQAATEQQLQSAQQQQAAGLPVTGHPTGFQTHHRFFRTSGARGGAGSGFSSQGYPGGSPGGAAGGGYSAPGVGGSGASFGGRTPSVPRLGGR
jgi:hypothetical protein